MMRYCSENGGYKKRMTTCEKRVFDRIFAALTNSQQSVILHGGNPPGGKSYLVRNLIIKIPVHPSTRHSRIDLVCQIDSMMILTELKCRLSQSSNDIEKLRAIRDNAPIENLIQMFEAQGVSFVTAPDKLVLCIGVEHLDADIPDDFVVIVAGEKGCDLQAGVAVVKQDSEPIELALLAKED